jgi:2-keto-4-pentenoate hydratase/2-oxohepta-3-ene-1,7-dioic acid hydratase in catechol pathway
MRLLYNCAAKAYISPSTELDVEIELACFISTPSPHFSRITIEEAADHNFGLFMLHE